MAELIKENMVVDPTEEAILYALAQYALNTPNRDFCNKVAEINTMMNNKDVADAIQAEAIDKALKAWAAKQPTPTEYKSLFRSR